MTYDQWKLATPPEYEEQDDRVCDECSLELYQNDDGDWLCEDCAADPNPPQHDAHIGDYLAAIPF